MLGAPAGLDDVIDYADFKKETFVEPLDDQATLEDSPDEQEIQALLSGNITVNGSRITVLQDGKKSYCLSLFSIKPRLFLLAGSLLFDEVTYSIFTLLLKFLLEKNPIMYLFYCKY